MSPNGALIDDEAFPMICTGAIDQGVYNKLDNSSPTSDKTWNRNWIKFLLTFSAVVLFASVVAVYVIHSSLTLPSVSFSSSFQSDPANHFNELLKSPPPWTITKQFKDTFIRNVEGVKSPTEWTENEWEKTFRTYLDYFHNGNEDLDLNRSMGVFKKNVILIHDHNSKSGERFSLRINQFGHLSFPEFKSRFLNHVEEIPQRIAVPKLDGRILASAANSVIPDAVNWVDKGCVTPVKNQEKCGACWAFSSTGSIEGGICAHGGKLVSLSEQELVDCAKPEGAEGCNGGYMDDAYKYVLDAEGICSEDAYPYTGKEGVCKNRRCTKVASIKGILSIPKDKEKAMKMALATYGPISAGVEADRATFQFYHTGIFSLPCGKKLNHAILLVGYGEDKDGGEPFWLVKNSWGSTWGEGGYIKLAREGHGKKGECGVLLSPTAPLIEDGAHDDR